MSRTLERSIARRQYEKFLKQWRQEKRLAGVYGKSGYKHPSFNEWSSMYQSNLDMMRKSTPADVVEHIGADPWAEAPREYTPQEIYDGEDRKEVQRGVITMNIAGSEDD